MIVHLIVAVFCFQLATLYHIECPPTAIVEKGGGHNDYLSDYAAVEGGGGLRSACSLKTPTTVAPYQVL